jgi:TonB family protein
MPFLFICTKKTLVISAILLLFFQVGYANPESDRKRAARRLADEIKRSKIRKVYVADFLDPSGVRSEEGCYFASVFSTSLKESAKEFEVANRIESQIKLTAIQTSAGDLEKPEALSRFTSEMGADAILFGTLTRSREEVVLSLSLNDSTGKALHKSEYREHLPDSFHGFFPATQDSSTHAYYFPGLDGVVNPKCITCTNPTYTDAARKDHFNGSLVVATTVNEFGRPERMIVLNDPGDGLAEQSLRAIQRWKFEPARDPSGRPVSVRLPIEVTFRLY